MTFEEIAARAARDGLTATGAFAPGPEDGAPDAARTLVLLGYGGPDLWARFSASPEFGDGAPHPLDRWSRRVIDAMAAALGAIALYPFGGPPHQPFIRWTYAAEPIHQSKLGMSIHDRYGLWSGWRGALAFEAEFEVPRVVRGAHPCPTCAAPCRSACPVNAFSDHGYDAAACRAHLNAPEGGPCRASGCIARRACPVGAGLAQSAEQAAFHLEAFRIA